jgi:hypothetical protein
VRPQCDEREVLGTRADEAHLAAHDVPELRELVELRGGEEAAHAREALVLSSGERRTVGVVLHLAELEHAQVGAALAEAAAAVEDRAAILELDRKRNECEDGKGEDEQQESDRTVEGALRAPVEHRCDGDR